MPTPRKKTPAHLEHLMPSGLTDEAIAARNAQPQRVAGAGRVVRDAAFEQRLARMEREVEHGADPFKEAIEEQRELDPDCKFRFLSDKVVKKRGMRGWEPAKNAKGELVRVADMTLGFMPTEIADLRDEKYRREGNDNVKNAHENLAESQERLVANARAVGISPLRRGDVVADDSQPEFAGSIGVTSQRG